MLGFAWRAKWSSEMDIICGPWFWLNQNAVEMRIKKREKNIFWTTGHCITMNSPRSLANVVLHATNWTKWNVFDVFIVCLFRLKGGPSPTRHSLIYCNMPANDQENRQCCSENTKKMLHRTHVIQASGFPCLWHSARRTAYQRKRRTNASSSGLKFVSSQMCTKHMEPIPIANQQTNETIYANKYAYTKLELPTTTQQIVI